MELRKIFCVDRQSANVRLGILVASLIFVLLFCISIFIYLRYAVTRRRRAYQKKYNRTAQREEKAEEDACKLLTYLAFLRKTNSFQLPKKRLSVHDARKLLSDDKWNEMRRNAYQEIMALYGKDESKVDSLPSPEVQLSLSSSSGSARALEHLNWYNENVVPGQTLSDDLELTPEPQSAAKTSIRIGKSSISKGEGSGGSEEVIERSTKATKSAKSRK